MRVTMVYIRQKHKCAFLVSFGEFCAKMARKPRVREPRAEPTAAGFGMTQVLGCLTIAT